MNRHDSASRLGELLNLIRSDMKPAFGVTEPGAIAFAVATARGYTRGPVEGVTLSLNSGMYKNAFTCGIPNSRRVGNDFAAALGAVGADPAAGLESLARITPQDNLKAQKLIDEGRVKVELSGISPDIHIRAEVRTAADLCRVTIEHGHTNIVSVELNGKIIFQPDARPGGRSGGKPDEQPGAGLDGGKNFQPETDRPGSAEAGQARAAKDRTAVIHEYTLAEILESVNSFDSGELSFMREAYKVNMELFQAGLDSPETTFVKALYRANGNRIFAAPEPGESPASGSGFSRELACAQLLCNGAIEARVLGLDKAAMSITGSGAHGIICTLPLLAWCEPRGLPEEKLLRATALSYLITMYIKEYSGRLSAFCGCAIAAGTGMACALAWLRGADAGQIAGVINNMASSITGMICDGGNQGCTMKGVIAVDAAFRAVELALAGAAVAPVHGINGPTPELTMKNMGRIASPGMVQTEKTILDIMTGKQALF